MKNVLFFIYRLYGGGAERVVSNLSTAFDDTHHVTIAVFSDETRTYPYSGELVRINLPFSKHPASNNKLKRFVRFLILVRKLRQLKRQKKIDVCISFGEQANIINLVSRIGERVCISMRTTLSKEMESLPKVRVLSSIIKNLYNRADDVIVPSELAALDLSKYFRVDKTKLKVIYNYIDPVVVNKLADEPIADADLSLLFHQKILLNVGRITPAKGQWLLFHVFTKLKNEYPGIRLVIIGEGESEHEFKTALVNLAGALGLKLFDRNKGVPFSLDYDVYLLGFEPNPFCFMRRAELLVFPSAFEGFPNTIIEAMESRIPVIAADCQSGPREILAPSTDPAIPAVTTEFAEFGVLAPALPTASIDEPIEERIIMEWKHAITSLLDAKDLREKYIAMGAQRAADFEREIILRQWKEIIG